jgi:hypothetical protein
MKTFHLQIFVSKTLEIIDVEFFGNDLMLMELTSGSCGTNVWGQCCSAEDLVVKINTKHDCFHNQFSYIPQSAMQKANAFGFINVEPLVDRPNYTKPEIILNGVTLQLFNINLKEEGWAAFMVSWLPDFQLRLTNLSFKKSFFSFFLHVNERDLPQKIYPRMILLRLQSLLTQLNITQVLSSTITIQNFSIYDWKYLPPRFQTYTWEAPDTFYMCFNYSVIVTIDAVNFERIKL